MARWKARAEFLLSVIELLFVSLTVEALQGKMCQNSLPSGMGRSLGGKISGGRGRPLGIFFGFYKTRHILLSNSAICTVLHAVVLTQYRRVTDRRTDGRTDGIAIANTALAMQLVRCGTDGRLLLSGFYAVVTLTLTLYRVIRHAIVHQSLTSIYIPNFNEIGKTFFWTD